MNTLTFGSLFAGIGGLDLGLERAGMECKWQVEIDEYARRVLAKHWPNVRRWDDITTFPPDANRKSKSNGSLDAEAPRVPDFAGWRVDLICGGFPCQDISYAGAGAGLAGERSGLFYEAVRVVRLLKPRFVLLENVAALLTRGMDQILGTLASLGYRCRWDCIPAAAVSAPHIRDRVFIYCDANGDRRKQMEQENKRRTPPIRAERSFDERTRRIRKSDWWAVEPDVGRVAHGVPNRVDRLRGLGNAVVPQVAEYIGRQIMESIQ